MIADAAMMEWAIAVPFFWAVVGCLVVLGFVALAMGQARDD